MMVIKNKRTEANYTVSDAEWQAMQDAGKAKLFDVVSRAPSPAVTIAKAAPRLPDSIEKVMKGNDAPNASNKGTAEPKAAK